MWRENILTFGGLPFETTLGCLELGDTGIKSSSYIKQTTLVKCLIEQLLLNQFSYLVHGSLGNYLGCPELSEIFFLDVNFS